MTARLSYPAAWLPDFNPYGFGQSPDWLAHANQVEDILQLRHQHYPDLLLDLGFYRDHYRAVLIQNQDWQQPLAQFQTSSVSDMQNWINQIVLDYA